MRLRNRHHCSLKVRRTMLRTKRKQKVLCLTIHHLVLLYSVQITHKSRKACFTSRWPSKSKYLQLEVDREGACSVHPRSQRVAFLPFKSTHQRKCYPKRAKKLLRRLFLASHPLKKRVCLPKTIKQVSSINLLKLLTNLLNKGLVFLIRSLVLQVYSIRNLEQQACSIRPQTINKVRLVVQLHKIAKL